MTQVTPPPNLGPLEHPRPESTDLQVGGSPGSLNAGLLITLLKAQSLIIFGIGNNKMTSLVPVFLKYFTRWHK